MGLTMRLNYFINVEVLWRLLLLFCLTVSSAYAHGPIPVPTAAIDSSTFPPIEEDLQALSRYSLRAQNAGKRLVERGSEILTQAHGVLADANTSLPQKLQLITVLSEIGDSRSAEVIIDAANAVSNNVHLQEYALVGLPNFEPQAEIYGYVDQQLEDAKRHPVILRDALAYYVKQPTKHAEKWAVKYAAADVPVNVRFAALYLGGALAMEFVKDDIFTLLQNKQKNVHEYYLLLGYAYVATLEEFDFLLNSAVLNKDNVDKARDFLEFRLANLEAKKTLAPDLLASGHVQLQRVAVKHLIDEKDAGALLSGWQQGDGLIRSSVKRAGYVINEDDAGASMVAVDDKHALPQWQIVLLIVAVVAVVLLAWFARVRKTR